MAWKAHLQNEMHWYNSYTSKIFVKAFSTDTRHRQQIIAKWSIIHNGQQFLLVYHRILYWVFVLFNLHKWLNKIYFINQQTICWWYLHYFFVVNDIEISEDELKNDLRKISMWVYQWKMSFNQDVLKQAQEVI